MMIFRYANFGNLKFIIISAVLVFISGCGGSGESGGSPSGTMTYVPNVTSHPQSTAENTITNANLTVGTITTSSSATVPQGHVISQSPAAGTTVNEGSTVNLVISSGASSSTTLVPDIVSQPQATGITMITQAGLQVGNVTTSTSNTIPAGSIISQQPAAGTTVNSGSTVSMVISQGLPGSPTPPSVSNVAPVNNATKVLVSLGEISVDFNSAIDPNTVNNSTFIVSNGVTGTLNVTNSNTRIRFTPNGTFSRGATYTVTLDGITDTDGNALVPNSANGYEWSFETCAVTSTATYTVSWDAIIDGDLSGYKVYYGTSTPLTKVNGTSQDVGTNTSWVLNPSNLGFLPCDNVNVAVTAVGSTKGESSLSQTGTISVD